MVGGDRNCRGPKECINGDECNEIKSELTSYAGKVIAEEELKGFKKKKKKKAFIKRAQKQEKVVLNRMKGCCKSILVISLAVMTNSHPKTIFLYLHNIKSECQFYCRKLSDLYNDFMLHCCLH